MLWLAVPLAFSVATLFAGIGRFSMVVDGLCLSRASRSLAKTRNVGN
jgi:hypothetical protein